MQRLLGHRLISVNFKHCFPIKIETKFCFVCRHFRLYRMLWCSSVFQKNYFSCQTFSLKNITSAFVQRSLGVDISQVRSVALDEWTLPQIAVMRELGNQTIFDRFVFRWFIFFFSRKAMWMQTLSGKRRRNPIKYKSVVHLYIDVKKYRYINRNPHRKRLATWKKSVENWNWYHRFVILK